MIVATVFGKIISIFIIMIVGVICCKMGIIVIIQNSVCPD